MASSSLITDVFTGKLVVLNKVISQRCRRTEMEMVKVALQLGLFDATPVGPAGMHRDHSILRRHIWRW